MSLLWFIILSSLTISSVALYFALGGNLLPAVNPGTLLNFLGFSIGAVALVATVGFLVLAFPIWNEMGQIAEERKEIAAAREETERLQTEIRQTLNDINSPYSRFTDLFQSLQLFSLVIRYIGLPSEDDDTSTTLDPNEETANERIERHISLVRHLMAAMAVDPESEPAAYLSLMRDAVGHLRATDDGTFFEFIESRLNAVRPTEQSLKDAKNEARKRFDIVRGQAAKFL